MIQWLQKRPSEETERRKEGKKEIREGNDREGLGRRRKEGSEEEKKEVRKRRGK